MLGGTHTSLSCRGWVREGWNARAAMLYVPLLLINREPLGSWWGGGGASEVEGPFQFQNIP